ncbi:MAG: SH3 domain-containing protein [Anaerolineae bacterium]|nr:SH3 domain-containing protein [Anaerolineae bacterium]
MSKNWLKLTLVLLVVLMAGTIAAQSDSPSIAVSDQISTGTVVIDSVFSAGPGFVVVRNDGGRGSPGPVLGSAAVPEGLSENVAVQLDLGLATGKLFAALHTDDGEVGVFEFGDVPGADSPVLVDDAPVNQLFTAQIIEMADQVVEENTVTALTVVTDAPGFLVIHADAGGTFGPVLGVAPLEEGRNRRVAVEIAEEGRTPILWPMLHVDTGVVGEYEFGTVEGADGPVVVNGEVATFPITAAEVSITVNDQFASSASVVVARVATAAPGFVVIRNDGGRGTPGPVLGSVAVPAGVSENVAVPLDLGLATGKLFASVHNDTGEAGLFEFGDVPGADAPATFAGEPVQQLFTAQIVVLDPQLISAEGTVQASTVVTDAPGFLVIHADAGGSFGPVLGYAPLEAGRNRRVTVELAAEGRTGTIWPMLHVDTGTVGEYEFGAVEGADGPVIINDQVAVFSFAASCEVTPIGDQAVNLRDAASTDGTVVTLLQPGSSASVVAQSGDWWQLADGSYVRKDVVTESSVDGCANAPEA